MSFPPPDTPSQDGPVPHNRMSAEVANLLEISNLGKHGPGLLLVGGDKPSRAVAKATGDVQSVERPDGRTYLRPQ